MLHLLTVVKAGASAAEFVKGGNLEADLGELELTAARDALRRIADARDQRAQFWSVINHLETAEAGFAKSTASRGVLTTAIRGFARGIAFNKLFFVRALMVVCYVYVREKDLCQAMLARMKTMISAEEKSHGPEIAGAVLHAFSGMALVNIAMSKDKYLTNAELREHLRTIEAFVTSHRM